MSYVKKQPVEVSAEIKAETDKAYLIFDGATEAWVPKSMVEYDGGTVFTMPEWLAEDKGFI